MSAIRSKYRSVPIVVDGIRFASKKEARRYSELKLMERVGEIHNLGRQLVYPLHVNGVLVCRYVADFVYSTPGVGDIVEDCKGYRTEVYRLKKKLFEAIYGIKILET